VGAGPEDDDLSELDIVTKTIRETERQLSVDPSGAIKIPDIDNDPPVRPHGPISELTLDAEQDKKEDILEDGAGLEPKLVKAQPQAVIKVEPKAAVAAPVQAAPPPPAQEKKQEKADDSLELNKLFSNDEDEENPLAALINSLPDVTAREIMDDLEEIKSIINDYQKKK